LGGIVIYAYGFFGSKTQAYIMGACIGVVLGAAQALSRSLYSQMIPAGRESSFFGLYEISEKGLPGWDSFCSRSSSGRPALFGILSSD
jgi:MFS-type transporter involved in bile tolerance (Atg22 family)